MGILLRNLPLAWKLNRGAGVALAVKDLDRCLELDPHDAWAFAERGLARLDQGEAEGAVADFDAALALEPMLVAALAGRGRARFATGDWDEALEDLDQAVWLDPVGAVHRSGFSSSPAPFAPGTLMSVRGAGLASSTTTATSLPWPTTLGGTQLLANGQAVALSEVAPDHITFLAPNSTAAFAASAPAAKSARRAQLPRCIPPG